MRSMSLAKDSSPESLGEIAWTPSFEELRNEISMSPAGTLTAASTPDPFDVVRGDLAEMSSRMSEMVKIDHPLLSAAASHFFASGGGGKRFRATMVLLVSQAACGGRSQPAQLRLAEIVEMIHTASLFHDDVIDRASTRRGVSSVNAKFGDKVAILAGDFLLARACLALAQLRNLDVVELLSTVIEHLVRGEIVQMRPDLDDSYLLEQYLAKNYYKTGSLMANGCRAALMLDENKEMTRADCDAAFNYGRHVGLAFQLVDDVLDFQGTDQSLGKPALNDLSQGLATAPTLFAAQSEPALIPLVKRKFSLPGDVEYALELINKTDAINQATNLAIVQAELAQKSVEHFKPSPARDALLSLATKVVRRQH